MADNTRVNDLQDKLLKAMDILNAQALNSISFDKTITCTIENDKDKKDGKYEVSDGNRIFTAYSNDIKLRIGDTVYVTVPEGNFENQKMIIGKKTTDNDKPFNFTQPFDTFFDMTGNILGENIGNELIANAINQYDNISATEYEQKLLVEKTDLAISNYTRLALKANFKSWIKEAVRGDYGLLIVLYTKEANAINEQPKTSRYSFIFNNSDMYGNPYNFETNYSQEIVIPLEKVNGVINKIQVYFYQNHNFYDKFNEPILCSEKGYLTEKDTNVYIKDDKGNYQLKENDTLLAPNLFVNNIYLSFGYDISIFTDDYVEIYTQNRNSYRRSTKVGNDYTEENQKEIKMRWVHLKDGKPIDMIAAAGEQPSKTDSNYEVRWYRYSIGAAAADEYCGIYWIEENGNGFNLVFNPDVNKQQEKIKAIILCDGIPYRSNELIFENEEQLPPNKEAQHIASALNIVCDDGTKGNYFLYGQGCRIKDQSHATKERTLSCYFDTNNDGIHESLIQDFNTITWIFPNKNTMIELIGRMEDEKEQETIKRNIAQPKYRIARNYNSKYTNNTIQCMYELNGVVYTTEIDLTFGKVGTMGSDQTLVIDFVGDTVAYTVGESTASFEVQLFDTSGTPQKIPEETVKWEWYCNEDTSEKVIVEKGNSILDLSNVHFNIEKLYILQATIGTLTTYFSIPIKNGSYSYIDGPTEVIYRSDGKPDYSDLPYQLYEVDGKLVEGVNWEIIVPETAFGYKYIGKIKAQNFSQNYYTREEIYEIDSSTNERVFVRNQYNKANNYSADVTYYEKVLDNFVGRIKDNKLQPVSIYIKDAPVYGIKAMIGTGQNKTTVWSQPIFVCQNQYPSTVINQWDGKSLVLDEENSAVIAAAVSAGRKNSDNTFSGVMMGDWSSEGVDTDGSISGQTGLYGFHHGDMSYAFKEDGTGFIGKSSMARINFDGSNATIYSAGYNQTNSAGMMIDLYGNNRKPAIYLKSANGNSTMELSTQDGGSLIEMKQDNNNFIKITNKSNNKPLTIGTKFSVNWDGSIFSKGGTIGGWKISTTQLQSDDGNLVLDTSGSGTILLKSSNSLISGGTIAGSTLSSTSGRASRIKLEGYFQLNNGGYIGEMETNLPGYNGEGVGMAASRTDASKGIVKATASNAGISFNNAYISTSNGTVSMGVTGKTGGFGIYNQTHKPSWVSGGDNINNIIYTDVPASNQFGIYARFA